VERGSQQRGWSAADSMGGGASKKYAMEPGAE
jgi:hypothetical protein